MMIFYVRSAPMPWEILKGARRSRQACRRCGYAADLFAPRSQKPEIFGGCSSAPRTFLPRCTRRNTTRKGRSCRPERPCRRPAQNRIVADIRFRRCRAPPRPKGSRSENARRRANTKIRRVSDADPRAEPEPLHMPKTVKADKAPGRHQGIVHELRGHRLLTAPMTVPDPRARKARREKGNAENRTNPQTRVYDEPKRNAGAPKHAPQQQFRRQQSEHQSDRTHANEAAAMLIAPSSANTNNIIPKMQ